MPLLILYILAGLILLGAIIALAWRGSGRRSPIPCPSWLGWVVELNSPFLKINRASEIIEHLHLQSGMMVLDLGCGPGRLTIPTAKLVGTTGRVTAFDLQDKMLQRVREKTEKEKLTNIEFIQGAAGEGKLGKDRYDRVLLVTVLGEIPDRQAALQEVFVCLKPGGIVSITEVIADPHFQTRRKVRELAGAAGFQEAEFFGNRISYTINWMKPGMDDGRWAMDGER
jgi:ubiquinone/menaquinone biosynthesis C-methylase UbiE